MAIIGISGYSGSGKDTAGRIIQYLLCKHAIVPVNEIIENYKDFEQCLEKASGYKIKKISYRLKQIASILTNIPIEKFEEQEFKTKMINSSITVREFLQKIGDRLREIDENIFINSLMSEYKENDNWIITDVRYPNEASIIKEKGGILIRIRRNGVVPINSHISETALDDWDFDYRITNDFSLVYKLKEIVNHAIK